VVEDVDGAFGGVGEETAHPGEADTASVGHGEGDSDSRAEGGETAARGRLRDTEFGRRPSEVGSEFQHTQQCGGRGEFRRQSSVVEFIRHGIDCPCKRYWKY